MSRIQPMVYSLALVILCCCYCETHNMLVVFPFPSKSHSILGDGVVKHLLDAGHKVTYITTFPKKKSTPNLIEVDISDNIKYMPSNSLLKDVMENKLDMDMWSLMSWMSKLSVAAIEHPNVQRLLNDLSQAFDLVIAENIANELSMGLSAVYSAPFVWFSSTDAHWDILSLVDEATNPAYVPNIISSCVPPFTFKQRLQELAIQTFGYIYREYISVRSETKLYEELFGPLVAKRGKLLPPYEELRFNASLVLSNSHVAMGMPIRLPQNFIPLAGYHVETHISPLPEDLKKLMDKANDGVIYFSLGSNLKSKDLPDEIKNNLLAMFGSLKQTVIWKFEEDLKNVPANVKILKWAPQSSILSHPNCRMFISHGGLLSTIETVHFGIPIVGVPIFGDQFNNVDRAVNKGYAKRVDLSYEIADKLKPAIEDVLSNSKFSNKAKELSLIYHDRPVPPGRELVHWVEHVIRTRGAPHLRSPVLMVPLYQKMYLDLVALVMLSLFIIVRLIKKVWRMLFEMKIKSDLSKKNI